MLEQVTHCSVIHCPSGDTGVLREESRPAPQSTVPEPDSNAVWYHEGPPELLAARYAVAEYSIAR